MLNIIVSLLLVGITFSLESQTSKSTFTQSSIKPKTASSTILKLNSTQTTTAKTTITSVTVEIPSFSFWEQSLECQQLISWKPQLFNQNEDCCKQLLKYNTTAIVKCDLDRRITSINIGTTYSPLPQVRLLGPNYLKLNTPIPEFIGNFEKLEILYLSGLKLTGKMPLSYKNLLNLKYFSVNNNMLEGELDDDFFYLMKDLISLDLGANKFTGKIPNSVSELTNLLNLDLHQNSFTGPLPDLSKLSNLGNGVFDRENGGFHGACYLNGLAETITKPGVCLPEKVTVPSKCSIGKVQLCTLDEMRSNKSSISVFVFGAGAILGITVGCFVLLALLLFLGICLKMRRISKPTKSASPLNERFEQNSNTNSLTGSDVPFNTQYPKDE